MKRLFCVLLLLITAGLYADQGKGAAVGGVLGSSLGGEGFGGNLGINFKIAEVPLFFAAYVRITSDTQSLGGTADKYFIREAIRSDYAEDLSWYLGGGAYIVVGSSDTGNNLSLGARLPIGISWNITREFELFFSLVPSAGVIMLPEVYFPDWFFAGELGLRYWFKK